MRRVTCSWSGNLEFRSSSEKSSVFPDARPETFSFQSARESALGVAPL